MGVKVGNFNPQYGELFGAFYPDATGWYATDEGELQVYQPVSGDEEFLVAEYARGTWLYVAHEPIPEVTRKEEGSNE